MAAEVVEQCQISPSDGGGEQSLPLVFFDIGCLSLGLIKILVFYSFPCSESLFLNDIVPNLKNSLSLTLNHFLPLAGKIIFPLTSGMPVSHYIAGEDSVSLTIALSTADFARLTGNHPRDAGEFHHFVPQITPADYSSDHIKFSVAAIQATLFPNQGICIGFSIHHGICDGAAVIHFIQTWSSIHKFNDDAHLAQSALPFYDRSVVQESNRLTPLFWIKMKTLRPTTAPSAVPSPSQKVRATFVMTEVEIKRLKRLVLSDEQSTIHVSSFTVVCGHIWSCLAKLEAAVGVEVGDDELEYLTCAADCRGRLNPTLPPTYFGNCLAAVVAESTRGRLRGSGGALAAARAVGDAVDKIINDEKGILDGTEKRLLMRAMKLAGKKLAAVIGSPRFDPDGADYGWGGSKKVEFVQIDGSNREFSLWKFREGGVEIGVVMSAVKMDAFAAIFNQGLIEAAENEC